ncbi:MAG: phage tail family protein [Lachnospiraceae bacterium]|nr:phage tail family protein [Lachnospiraceae bacterium]MCM1229996.1 phage tail family protein [Ruminococcus flavefaciens]
MRFSLILENEYGEKLDFSSTANRYMTSKIEGLNPPNATISTSTYAGMNGSYLNNAFIEKRNVVIGFEMRGIDIEKRRHALYRVVKTSRYIKVYYRTANIDVYTEGYVETCEISNFQQLVSGQISILCPDIYWYSTSTQTAEYSAIKGAFHFPFPDSDEPFPIGVYNTHNTLTIQNDGDETGFTIIFSGNAENPILTNVETGEYLQISGSISDGDTVTITTKTGGKTVTLEHNGVTENIINRLVSGSTWLALRTGENKFDFSGGTGLKVHLIHRNAYLGV